MLQHWQQFKLPKFFADFLIEYDLVMGNKKRLAFILTRVFISVHSH